MFKVLVSILVIVAVTTGFGSAGSSEEWKTILVKRNYLDLHPVFSVSMPARLIEELEPKRQQYLPLMKEDKYEEALPLIEKVYGEIYKPESSRNEEDNYKLLLVQSDRIKSLLRSNRQVEALLEAHKAKQFAIGIPAGAPASTFQAAYEKVMGLLEDERKGTDDESLIKLIDDLTGRVKKAME